MPARELEINRLGPGGECLRKIVCMGSRINVLRAAREDTLALYRDALTGKNTTERFSIILDGETFRPEDHRYIGFGENFGVAAHTTVEAFLCSAGFETKEIEPFLLRFGLGGCSEQRCGSLSSAEQMVLKVLSATQTSTSVIVLEKPFEGLQSNWRENLAQYLVEFVSRREGLIVVTDLTVRPDVWIDNPYLARLQLERPRQATIGFGAALPVELAIPIQQPIKQDQPMPIAALEHPPAYSRTSTRTASAPTTFVAVAVMAIFIGLIVLAVPGLQVTKKPRMTPETAAKVIPHETPKATTSNKAPAQIAPPTLDGLNGYPAELRGAILLAFEGPNSSPAK